MLLPAPAALLRRDVLTVMGTLQRLKVIERYGTTSGFNRKVGDVVDALIYTYPFRHLLQMPDRLLLFLLPFTQYFSALFSGSLTKDSGGFIGKIELDKKIIEDISKEVLNLNHEMEDIVAERTMGMVG